jgi:hypothetical protein
MGHDEMEDREEKSEGEQEVEPQIGLTTWSMVQTPAGDAASLTILRSSRTKQGAHRDVPHTMTERMLPRERGYRGRIGRVSAIE